LATVEVTLSDLNSLLQQELSSQQVTDSCALIGIPLEKAEGGTLVLEINPNRPDWLCVEGIARSLSSFLSQRTGLREYPLGRPKTEAVVEPSFVKARPFASAFVARNVKLTGQFLADMMQLQEKLCDTLGRRRHKISMGAYDLSKLMPPFTYTARGPRELSFVPLEMKESLTLEEILQKHPKGKLYAPILRKFAQYPVILDARGEVLCLIPVTNGESSRLVEGTTCDLFVEVNGTSKAAVDDCAAILYAQLADRGVSIEQVAFRGAINQAEPAARKRQFKVGADAVEKLLGVRMAPQEIAQNLERMGFGTKVDAASQSVTATVPVYRNDIMAECDLVEDAGIAFGYQNYAGREPPFATIGARDATEAFADRLRELMAGLGFQDCITFTLTNEATHYGRMNAAQEPHVEIGNPLTNETTMVRTALLPSLLSVLEANKDQKYPQKLSEVGDVVVADSQSSQGCSTRKRLCAVIASKNAGLSEIKSAAEALLKELGADYSLCAADLPFYIPTRSAKIAGKKVDGHFGEVHPQVLENFSLLMPVAALEIWFD
jgi:phenylalanyl-tRNA synthetase beta chain